MQLTISMLEQKYIANDDHTKYEIELCFVEYIVRGSLHTKEERYFVILRTMKPDM